MKRITARTLLLLVAAVSMAVLGADDGYAGAPKSQKAISDINGCTDPGITGSAILSERVSDEGIKLVDVTVVVRGLPEGKHAVHIHEVGDCDPCIDAGGHFDPGPAGLSSPDGNHPFHSGDLVNLEVQGNGEGVMHTTTSRITLSPGPLSILDANGSAIIIHVNPDTYCPGGPASGCAGGGRQACGVIEPTRSNRLRTAR